MKALLYILSTVNFMASGANAVVHEWGWCAFSLLLGTFLLTGIEFHPETKSKPATPALAEIENELRRQLRDVATSAEALIQKVKGGDA